jgi:hypothetical protein
MTSRSYRSILIAVLVLLAACGPSRHAASDDASRPTPVRVENQSWSDMRIYVVVSGLRQRLGVVTGGTTQTLQIPASVVGLGREISFLADPIAGRTTAQSFSIFVRPGETVRITIPSSVR